MSRVFEGQLEITDAGVVYFHTADPALMEQLGTQTLVRIEGMGPLPELPLEIRTQRVVVNGTPAKDITDKLNYHN